MSTATFEVKNGCFGYPHGRQVLNNISFAVKKGEILAILGPNGAGKTTMLRCMMGFLKWTSGQSLLEGEDIAAMSHRKLFSRVAYVPQAKNATLSSSVKDMVLLGRSSQYGIFGKPSAKDRQMVMDTLARLGLSAMAECSCSELSGGELQMVLIARAIVAEPEVIVLDEPESNLDFKNQLIVLKTLRSLADQGITCIFNTHYPVHALRHADKALLLDKSGTVRFGSTSQVITEENMRLAFGVETVIGQIETPHNEYADVLAVNTLPDDPAVEPLKPVLKNEEPKQESENECMTQLANDDSTRLATLSIIVEDRENAEKINAMLHEYGQYIIGRMGMPYPKKEVSIICVVIDAPETVISTLSGKLGQLRGVSMKTTYSKK